MGFGLKSPTGKAVSLRFVLFCALVFSLAGCLGDSVKPHNGALGTEVPDTTMAAALAHATDGISIQNAKVGDCVTYELNYRINADPVIMSQILKHKLLSITQATNSVTYNLFEDLYEYMPSGAPSNQVHRQLPLDFSLAPAPAPSSPWHNCAGQVTDDGDGIKYDCVRYYNLEADDALVDAPEAVKQKPNCLGFANCQIPVHHVKYDAVKFLNGQQVNKVTIEANFSSAIPDLLYILNSDGSISYTEASTSFCTATIVTGGPDNSNYLLRQCYVLQDMNTGGTGDCSPATP